MSEEIVINKNSLLRKIKLIGWINIGIAVFILCPLLIFIEANFFDPYQKYDHEQIIKNGQEKLAKITSIQEKPNFRHNGKAVSIVSYTFSIEGQDANDKFQTIDKEKLAELSGKDSIKIVALDKKSVIPNLQRVDLSIRQFWAAPIIFIILGGLIVLICSLMLARSRPEHAE